MTELLYALVRILISLWMGAFVASRCERISIREFVVRLVSLCGNALMAKGTLTRAWFVYAGISLGVIKGTFDVIVFRRNLSFIVEYWLTEFPTDQAAVHGMLSTIAWAIPFIWLGTGLSLMRLRDAGLPRILVLVFFVPVANLLFFLMCAAIPSSNDRSCNAVEGKSLSFFLRMLPESNVGVAAFTLLLCSLIGVLGVLAGAYGLGNYGAPLFLGLPFLMGFCAAILYGIRQRRSLKECLSIAWLALFFTAVALVCFLIEGVICILALFPIAAVLTAVGAVVGYSCQTLTPEGGGKLQSSLVCGLALAAALAIPVPNSPTLSSVTTITINRAPIDVWPHVIAFSEIKPPKEWLFLQGVAYPVRARIEGSGVGAIRYCEFSTGPFVEPITVWNEPHELRFTVTETPPALTEYNPLGQVIAPHLDGYFESLGGQFILKEVAPLVTEIRATTWYTHKVAPVWYWRLISDPILHLIHTRVLQHIKDQAEAI